MTNRATCKFFLDPDYPGFLVEYRGNLMEQLSKIDYACGSIITDTLAVIAVELGDITRLRNDVPAIIFFEDRSPYILQDVSPSNIEGITEALINPYLNLTGRGILIGMIDSGIDYLNKEFTREDGTSRIHSIWDQSLPQTENATTYIGNIYSNSQINKALENSRNNQDPYLIVPSKDTVGHGTAMASIIGARGYDKTVKGVAPDCEFVVVKLFPSPNYAKSLKENNLPYVETYNNSEVMAGIEYLNKVATSENKPMVIFFGVGTTQGPHTGNGLTSKYLTRVTGIRGVIVVIGAGNEGDKEGHALGFLKNSGSIDTVEINIPKQLKNFSFSIWITSPNRMSISITYPAGESTGFIRPNLAVDRNFTFVLTNSRLRIRLYDPEEFTGQEAAYLDFNDMASGIWKIQLLGDYIVDGRYDVWLYPSRLLPPGTKILNSNPLNTLTIPSTGMNVITNSYYDSINNTLLSESGKGFNTNGYINPDVTSPGINILATSPGDAITKLSGSSAATSLVAGICALLLQWGIVDGNDKILYSPKIKSYVIYGSTQKANERYPNESTGYGYLSLINIFKILGGIYRSSNFTESSNKNIFIRMDQISYKYFEKRSDLFI